MTHYTLEEMEQGNMVPLLANGGKTGVLIHDHGDGRIEATALFNTSGIPHAGRMMLERAVRLHGVNYVECFGPKLNTVYEKVGFRDTDVYPFDPTQEPPGWDHKQNDEPSYHIMRIARTPDGH